MIDRLLGKAEPPRASPSDLDDHERGRRTRVDRHDIEFVAADMDVPGQDGPTGLDQSSQDQRFRGITRQLGRGPRPIGRWHVHGDRLALDPHPARIRDFTATLRGELPATEPAIVAERRRGPSGRRHLERRQVDQVECRVVGHDRHELAFEQLMGRWRRRRIPEQIEIELIAR